MYHFMFNEKVIINSVGRELKGGKEKAMSLMMNEGLENQMLGMALDGSRQMRVTSERPYHLICLPM